MARRFVILAVQLLMASVLFGGLNSWTTAGPYGGGVLALASDPANSLIAYCGTNSGGVFKTTDGGTTWLPNNNGLGIDLNVSVLTIDPTSSSTLYAASLSVYKSIDGASSWSKLPLTPSYGIQCIAIDPLNSLTLYAGEYAATAIWKSTDGGSTWALTNGNLPASTGIAQIAIDPYNSSRLYATLLDGNLAGVYSSIDGGTTWTWLHTSDFCYLAINPITSATIYALECSAGNVIKSTDYGATWSALSPINGLGTPSALELDPLTPTHLYVAGFSGIALSDDDGLTWTTTEGNFTEWTSLAVSRSNPAIIYTGSYYGYGLFRSTNYGHNWSASINGLGNTPVYSLGVSPVDPLRVIAGTNDQGISLSTDGGRSWCGAALAPVELVTAAPVFDPSTAQIIWVGAGHHVYRSTDGGNTWAVRDTGLAVSGVGALALDTLNPSILYAGDNGSNGVFRTTDDGLTWNGISIPAADIRALSLDPTNQLNILLGSGTGIAGSTDGGFTWVQSNLSAGVVAMSRSLAQPSLVMASAYTTSYASTDGGSTWLAMPGLAGVYVTDIRCDPVDASIAYAGTYGNGVLRTTDGGITWSDFNNGLTTLAAGPLAEDASGTFVHVGSGGNGIYDFQVATGTDPSLAGLSPASGPRSGGTLITVSGGNFQTGDLLSIGSTPAIGMTIVSPSEITATSPPHACGAVAALIVDSPFHSAWLPNAFFYDFDDVSAGALIHPFVVKLITHGISAGCSITTFCPSASVSRAQMAVFLLSAEHGACYRTPPAEGIFGDMPASNPFTPWAETLFAEGITGGCSSNPLTFCPGNSVLRSQMAVFLLSSEHGAGYLPPQCAGLFADVPCPGAFSNWIEELYNEGITGGCGTNPLTYCPNVAVSRGQMAIFLSVTYNLQ